MELKQSQIDTFLTQFRRECDRFGATLKVVSSCNVGSHYYLNQITLDSAQIQDFVESSNADPLEVWRVVGYHELGHHRGYISEESCWNWMETQTNLDQPTVACIRSQVTVGSSAMVKGRNWQAVKDSLNCEIIKRFVVMNQLSSVVKEAAGIQTPGRCWYFLKTQYQHSLNLEKIITPILPDSKGYLLELCHSQKYDFIETEVAGLLLWRQIQPLL